MRKYVHYFGFWLASRNGRLSKLNREKKAHERSTRITEEKINVPRISVAVFLCMWSGDAGESFKSKICADRWIELHFAQYHRWRMRRSWSVAEMANGNLKDAPHQKQTEMRRFFYFFFSEHRRVTDGNCSKIYGADRICPKIICNFKQHGPAHMLHRYSGRASKQRNKICGVCAVAENGYRASGMGNDALWPAKESNEIMALQTWSWTMEILARNSAQWFYSYTAT